MFKVNDRDRLRDYVLELAASDQRIVAGAVVGSLALNEGDRWSDLDLTFAVSDGIPVGEVLADWTRNIVRDFDAVPLFDLPSGAFIYRVFLIPDCLQFDLSFAPTSEFSATGPKFRLLFGSSVSRPHPALPSIEMLFGYAVHHALRARFSIERERYWEAEYWISGVRDYALSLACLRRDLPSYYGKGFDRLPPNVRAVFSDALVKSLTRDELLRALGCAIDGLLSEKGAVQDLAGKTEPQLRKLTTAWE